MTSDPLEREKLFQRWWKASKYCQVIYPKPHLEQYARDGFVAGLAAALASDTHNHREPGEFGEGATVRRSPYLPEGTLLKTGKDVVIMFENHDDAERAFNALEEIVGAKP